MSLAATVTKAGSTVVAIGIVGGGALTLDHLHAPRSAITAIESQLRVDRIFDLVDQAAASGSPDWLCRAIEQEFISLCTEQPDHYLCTDPDAKRGLKARAGCG